MTYFSLGNVIEFLIMDIGIPHDLRLPDHNGGLVSGYGVVVDLRARRPPKSAAVPLDVLRDTDNNPNQAVLSLAFSES